MSTCDPADMPDIASTAAAKGIELVEAPISGTSADLEKMRAKVESDAEQMNSEMDGHETARSTASGLLTARSTASGLLTARSLGGEIYWSCEVDGLHTARSSHSLAAAA